MNGTPLWLGNFSPEVVAIILKLADMTSVQNLRLASRDARDLVDALWKPMSGM
jgi:tRNA G46 methylase TrmB